MKSGYVAVIGRANAGKSTLVNALVGEKVAIVSPKPQTTRDRILGILTRDDFQIVFADTPGLYKQRNELTRRMMHATEETVKDVDAILFVEDAHEGISDEDIGLIQKYSALGLPMLVALTKTDIMPEKNLPEVAARLFEAGIANEAVAVSARKRKNLGVLIEEILKLLPEGEKLYAEDILSDKSEKFMIAEIMREKILLGYEKEIPHGAAVVVNEFVKKENGVYSVNLDIVCEKKNHKAILIGKGGAALKETAVHARREMERFLGAKVFLTVYVKVREDWRNSDNLIGELGYGDL
jgi:GTP-binding protein Era